MGKGNSRSAFIIPNTGSENGRQNTVFFNQLSLRQVSCMDDQFNSTNNDNDNNQKLVLRIEEQKSFARGGH